MGGAERDLGDGLWAQQGLRSRRASLVAGIVAYGWRSDIFPGVRWFRGGVPDLLQRLSGDPVSWRRHGSAGFGMAGAGGIALLLVCRAVPVRTQSSRLCLAMEHSR